MTIHYTTIGLLPLPLLLSICLCSSAASPPSSLLSLVTRMPTPRRGLAVFSQLLDECMIPVGPTGALIDVFIEMVLWDGTRIMALRVGSCRTTYTTAEVQWQLTYCFPTVHFRARAHFARLDEIAAGDPSSSSSIVFRSRPAPSSSSSARPAPY